MTTVLSPVARRAAEAARHLPGKHDQKSHGKGHGTPQLEMAYDEGLVGQGAMTAAQADEALPNWGRMQVGAEARPGTMASIRHPFFDSTVSAAGGTFETEGQAVAAVVRTAKILEPYLDTYDLSVDVSIADHLERGVGGQTTLVGEYGSDQRWTTITMNRSLLDVDSAEAGMYRESSAKGWFGPGATRVDAYERSLTHEIGHAVAFKTVEESRGLVLASLDRDDFDAMSGQYAQANWSEAYAEGFADWHTRTGDVSSADPSEAQLAVVGVRPFAHDVAVAAGWEGAA